MPTSAFQHAAARRRLQWSMCSCNSYWCFNTQPPEGGCFCVVADDMDMGSFNTQPPEGGWRDILRARVVISVFQHAAARRRLVVVDEHELALAVSTRSRPKAAVGSASRLLPLNVFQHAAARRRLSLSQKPCSIRFRSPDFAKLPRKARTRV